MKIKEGGTIRFTLMPNQYQPIAIESTFEIEKDVSEDYLEKDDYKEFVEKISDRIEKRLERNIELAMGKLKETKRKYKDLLT